MLQCRKNPAKCNQLIFFSVKHANNTFGCLACFVSIHIFRFRVQTWVHKPAPWCRLQTSMPGTWFQCFVFASDCQHLLYTKACTWHGVSSAEPGIAKHGDPTFVRISLVYCWQNQKIVSKSINCQGQFTACAKLCRHWNKNHLHTQTAVGSEKPWKNACLNEFAKPNTLLLCLAA